MVNVRDNAIICGMNNFLKNKELVNQQINFQSNYFNKVGSMSHALLLMRLLAM